MRKTPVKPELPRLEDIVETLRAGLPELRDRYGVESLGIFDSYVRGEQRPRSDLDVLVEFKAGTGLGLFDFLGLKDELSNLLRLRVDLVDRRELKPYIGQRILREVLPVVDGGEKPPLWQTPEKENSLESKREIRDFLNDILDNIVAVDEFCRGLDYEAFAADRTKVYAVLHALFTIGEAARHMRPDLRRRHPTVPWRQVVGLRNVVAHEYFAVYLPKIWEIVQESLPPLRKAVACLRDELGGRGAGRQLSTLSRQVAARVAPAA